MRVSTPTPDRAGLHLRGHARSRRSPVMIASRLATALGHKQVHYGWVVVGVTFLTMLVTAGAVGAPGVLILPLQQEFGWQTAEISSALALRLVLFGLMGPFAAALMNRYGVRPITLAALGLIATGLFLSL